jgi:hypothetical protein
LNLPGDFNGDDSVDAADYVVWRKGLGTTFTADDYIVWRANFGKTAGSGFSTNTSASAIGIAIPEPASMILISVGVIASNLYLANRRYGKRSCLLRTTSPR